MPVTYKLISTVTVSTATQAAIEFTSIPATFDDLVIKVSARTNAANVTNVAISFNGSTANFSTRNLFGDGSTAASFSANNNTTGILQGTDYTASTFTNGEIYIPNYVGSTNKSFSVDMVTENNATASYQVFNANLWSQTAAITSIKIESNSGSLVQYSTAYLYGIKKS